MTRVDGWDLSLTATGVSLPSGQTFTIKPSGAGDRRLVHIRDALDYYVTQSAPDVAVIEEPIVSTRGGFKSTVVLLGVHLIAREVLARHGVPYAYIHAATLKKYATGSGGASKQNMIDACFDAGGEPADDNQADAWWLRAAGKHHYDRAVPSLAHALSLELISGPRSKVKWPDLPMRPHDAPGGRLK